MATKWHRRLITIILFSAIAATNTGCNMLALPFFLIPGLQPKHEPRCKLAPEDKEKHVKAVILISGGLETRPEFLSVDRELSQMLVRRLSEAFKANEENVNLVPASKVTKYKDDHPNWQSLSPAEMGKYFKADYVINLEINSISLYETGSSNTLFRGRTSISIDVIDVKKVSEGPMYEEEYTCEFPKVSGPIPVGDSNALQFRQAFLSAVAKELTWRFSAHLNEDERRMD